MSGLLGLLGLLGPDGRGLGLAFLQRLLGLGLRVVLELELGPLEFRLAQRGGLARRRLGRGLGLRFPRRLSISLCSFVRSGRGVGFRGRAVRRGLLRGDAVRFGRCCRVRCCLLLCGSLGGRAVRCCRLRCSGGLVPLGLLRRKARRFVRLRRGRLGLRLGGLRRGGCRGGGLPERLEARAGGRGPRRRRRGAAARPVPGPLGRGAGGVEVGPHGLKGCQE